MHTDTLLVDYGQYKFHVLNPEVKCDIVSRILIAGDESVTSNFVNIFSRHVKSGYRVLDIGAELGCVSVVMADLVGEGGKVFALEPNEYLIGIIKENVRINNLEKRVEIIQKGCFDKNGTFDFYESLDNIGQSGVEIDGSARAEMKSIKKQVELCRVDDVIKERIDFIKMDVEGAEYRCLLGMQNLLREYKPKILMETGNCKKYEEQYEFLTGLGYGVYNPLTEEALSKEQFFTFAQSIHDVLVM